MIKYFLLVIVLASCANNGSITPKTRKKFVADSAHLRATNDTVVTKPVRLFDNQKPFKVILSGNRIERNTTDEDTIKCNTWTLIPKQVSAIIKNSQTINGTEWDLVFGVLCCSVYGVIIQNNIKYPFTVNAGSYVLINSGDTTIIYGDYSKGDKKNSFPLLRNKRYIILISRTA